MPGEDGEFTELYDAIVPRVDLVGQGASGVPRWLLMKQDASAGLMDPDFVRDLIAKAEPEGREQVETPNGITLKGSPADIAAFIHKAAKAKEEPAKHYKGVTDAAKRKFVSDLKDSSKNPVHDIASAMRRLSQYAASGHLPHGTTYADLKWMYDQCARELHRRDPKSKAGGHFPAEGSGVKKEAAVDEVAKCQAMQSLFDDAGTEVKKAAGDAITDPDLDAGRDGMDPGAAFAPPDDDDAPGDPSDPGSPAWEAIDAATAQKWLAIASRLRNALGLLADRELLEAASADPDDADKAMDLQDAQCAVDYVISVLAVFAAQEQAEAELGAECEAAVKALAGAEVPLASLEGLAPVAKAGRVLSAANEAAIRDAVASLQKVLASLPEAPVTKSKEALVAEDKAAEVAKESREEGMPQAETSAGKTAGSGQAPEMGSAAAAGKKAGKAKKARAGKAGKAEAVAKASKLPVVVYGQNRVPLGCVPRAAIVAKAASDEKTPMQAVFSQDGDLIGVVDPAQIQPVAGAAPKKADAPGPEQADTDGAAHGATDAQGGGSQPEPATAPAGDMQPAPAASAGTPAAGVAKAEKTTAGQAPAGNGKPRKGGSLKKKIAKAVSEALGAQSAAHQEVVAKMAADKDALAERLEEVSKRLETVEKSPAPPKVFTSGQVPRGPVPPPEHLRGHDKNAPQQIDVAKGLARKAEMYTAPASEQNRIAKEMEADAVAALTALHAAGPGRPAA